MNKKVKDIYIIGGGTIEYVSNHLSLSAPAYGKTAKVIKSLVDQKFKETKNCLVLTKMAGGGEIETSNDLKIFIENIVKNNRTKVIFFTPAVCDFSPSTMVVEDHFIKEFSKNTFRLKSSSEPFLYLKPIEKIVPLIRKTRKDIFLVAFKTTCGASEQEMYERGLNLCKTASCNLVLVNDTKTYKNMIVTPEEASYHITEDRQEVLENLVDMAYHRSHLTFTQSTVIDGTPIPWDSNLIPDSLRKVVNHCINANAYKPFNGATVGHFACKLSDTEFLTSIRKSNFNDLHKNGLVKIKTDGPDTVLAYGAKPSVGGQSQRMVFSEHEGMDCICHFHSPLKDSPLNADIPQVSQREVECGSHQCGSQTSKGLKQFGNLKAVYLKNHGPNIVFNKNINPQEVIDFINNNFDLSEKTGGFNI